MTNSPSVVDIASQPTSLQMQQMSLADFQLTRHWCMQEGWNLGVHDAAIYFNTDVLGHFIFFDHNVAVGSMSLVKHDESLFTIGPFIVASNYRHQGYGAVIWQQVMTRLNNYPNASVLLYAVDAQVERYRACGFNVLYKNVRWVIRPTLTIDSEPMLVSEQVTLESISDISCYDQAIFTANRHNILLEALKQPGIKAFAVRHDNTIKGYGLIRPCLQGYRIGPLFADNQSIAKTLLASLLAQANDQEVIIDLPEPNQDANQLMAQLGAIRQESYDTIAMVKGPLAPDYLPQLSKNYGLFSLEIG